MQWPRGEALAGTRLGVGSRGRWRCATVGQARLVIRQQPKPASRMYEIRNHHRRHHHHQHRGLHHLYTYFVVHLSFYGLPAAWASKYLFQRGPSFSWFIYPVVSRHTVVLVPTCLWTTRSVLSVLTVLVGCLPWRHLNSKQLVCCSSRLFRHIVIHLRSSPVTGTEQRALTSN